MSQQERPIPWVALFSGPVAVIVFVLALGEGLGQAVLMGVVAFVVVFVPLGLAALALETWRDSRR